MENKNEQLKVLYRERLAAEDAMAETINVHLRIDSFFFNCAVQAWLGNMNFETDEDIFQDMFIVLCDMLEKNVSDLREQFRRYHEVDDRIIDFARSEE